MQFFATFKKLHTPALTEVIFAFFYEIIQHLNGHYTTNFIMKLFIFAQVAIKHQVDVNLTYWTCSKK